MKYTLTFFFALAEGKAENDDFFVMMVLSLGFLGSRLGLSWGTLGDLLGDLVGISRWVSLGALLGLSWALLGSLGALLGLSGGLLGRSWGQGRDDDDGDDGPCGPLGLESSFGPSWLPLLGPNLAHLASMLVPFWLLFFVYLLIHFWVSFRTYFLEASWALLWPRSRPGERKKEPCAAQKLSKPFVFTVFWACRFFCFFRASWCRLGALLAPTWPLSVEFWTPKEYQNDSQK